MIRNWRRCSSSRSKLQALQRRPLQRGRRFHFGDFQIAFRSVSGPLLALAMVASAGPAAADADMTLIYSRYHMAIRAAILCRQLRPDAETWRRWATYIDAKTEHELGAGERLSAI